MLTLEQLLLSKGPCLTSTASAHLQRSGLSAVAARKRVARANGEIRRLPGLIFPKGARFLYHESTYNSVRYWNALVAVLETSPAYGAAINALRARGGIVPERFFHIACGSPVLQKGQVASQTVLERLLAIELVERCSVRGVGPCVRFAARSNLPCIPDQVLRARHVTERILLLAVKDWARKLGLASHDAIRTRDDKMLPKVGTCLFDLSGPSYVHGLAQFSTQSRPRPAFLVCDVIASDNVDTGAVQAFLRKVSLLSGLRKLAPVIPMLVATRFDADAFKFGRSRGVVMATPRLLFGKEVAAALRTLLRTLSKAAAVAAANPEAVVDLFDKLGRIEGAAANLRGALFECLVALCVKQVDGGHIEVGEVVEAVVGDEIKRAEVDVLRIREHQDVWAYECKGHQPNELIDAPLVREWLEKKVPVIYNDLRKERRFQGCAFRFEFWTCGDLSVDAVAYLEDARDRIQKYGVGWKSGADVRKYAAKVQPRALAEMLDQHFFKHPIAFFGREHKANPELERMDAESDDESDGTEVDY